MTAKVTADYTTRVQCAVSPDLFEQIKQLLHKQACFELCKDRVTSITDLVNRAATFRPDIVLIEMSRSELDLQTALKPLTESRFPPYLVVIASRHDPYLIEAEQYKAVRATLLYQLAASPLLSYVLRGVAEGYEYFTPPATFNFILTDLSFYQTVLLALMAIGLETQDLAADLKCSHHTIYTAQSFLRKKLGVQTNEQAILLSVRRKFVGMLTEPKVEVFGRKPN